MYLTKTIETIGDHFHQPITLSNVSLPDQPLVYINRPFTELTKYESQDVLGKNCRFLQGRKSDKESVLRIRNAISNKEPICQDLLNYTSTGEEFYNRLVLIPFKEKDSVFFVGLQHHITEKEFKLKHDLDRMFLEDKALNPLTILVSILMHPHPDQEKNISDTIKRIKDFVLSL